VLLKIAYQAFPKRLGSAFPSSCRLLTSLGTDAVNSRASAICLTQAWGSGLAIQCTLVEIDGFAALGTGMHLVKLVGEYLFLFAAFGAFADK
jgi:hypothetical protein